MRNDSEFAEYAFTSKDAFRDLGQFLILWLKNITDMLLYSHTGIIAVAQVLLN